MKRITAEQQRFIDNAVLIVAVRLSFDALARVFPVQPLSAFITIHNGQGLTAENRQQQGDYPVYAAGGLIGRHDNQLSDAPFVVIGRKGSAGKTTYAPSGGWVIDTAYYAQPNDAALLNCKFLFYAVSSLDFSRDIISTAIPGINRTSIYKYPIPIPPIDIQLACVQFLDAAQARNLDTLEDLPPPLDDQRRIVAQIDALATQIEEARGFRRSALEDTEIMFASALTRFRKNLISECGNQDYLGSVTQVTSGGTPSRENIAYWGGPIPWVKTGELLDRDIYRSEEHITEEGLLNSSAKLFPVDTILIALYGQGQTRGRTGRLRIEATTNQACCAVLPAPSILDCRFVQWWLRSLYYEMREISQGGAQPNWNISMIKKIIIALPTLKEQRQIVARLDALQAQLDVLRSLQRESAAELDALLPSILDRAFRGEL